MSEKRFEYDPSINHFTDTETNKEYCEYNLDKVVDLLNEQDTLIKQLKKELKKKDEIITKYEKSSNNKKFDDGRCCSICGNLETEYHDWDSSGTWTSESKCRAGHDLDETNGTQCEDFILEDC